MSTRLSKSRFQKGLQCEKALWLEENGGGPAEMAAILDAGSRPAAGPTAPACGLFLERVLYDETVGS